MAAKPGTDLIVAGESSSFLALRMPEQELRDLIQTNLGGGTLDVSVLDRVKTPTGGRTKWDVPTLDGEETVETISGVIIHWATRRAYWENTEPDGSPPDCSSPDAFNGFGNPGGQCQACPLNVFGTDQKGGPGKACTEFRQMFLLQEDAIIPLVINAMPGSLKTVQQYFVRLLRAGVPSTAVVTTLKLERAANSTGQEYAKIIPVAGQRLDPDARARMEHLADQLKPAFERVIIEQQEAHGPGDDE